MTDIIDKIEKILKQEETEDITAPYRCLPIGDNKWVEIKAKRISALPILKKCGECAGNGYIMNTVGCYLKLPCPTCKGKGEVPEMVEVECPQKPHRANCKMCDVTGKIKRPKTLGDLIRNHHDSRQ